MRVWNYSRRWLIAGICLSMTFAATGNDAGTLPAEAREALDRGMTAAQRHDWDAAIKHFRAAHESAPFAPRPLINLGLATQRAGNRDAVAIAWFRAFLAAAPDAVNVDTVRDNIGRLEKKLNADVDLLIAQARRMMTRIEAGHEDIELSLILLQMDAGWLLAAEKAAYSFEGPIYKAHAFAHMAQKQIAAGQRQEALLSAKLSQDALAGASQIDKMTQGYARAFGELSRAQLLAGDLAAALESARAAVSIDRHVHIDAFKRIAMAQSEDWRTALNTLAVMDSMKDDNVASEERNRAYYDVLLAIADHGDVAGVQAGAAKLPTWHSRYGYEALARAKAVSGDVAGAQEEAARFPVSEDAKAHVAEGLALRGDLAEAHQIAKTIETSLQYTRAMKCIARCRAERGDYDGAINLAENLFGTTADRSEVSRYIAERIPKTGHHKQRSECVISFWTNLAVELEGAPRQADVETFVQSDSFYDSDAFVAFMERLKQSDPDMYKLLKDEEQTSGYKARMVISRIWDLARQLVNELNAVTEPVPEMTMAE